MPARAHGSDDPGPDDPGQGTPREPAGRAADPPDEPSGTADDAAEEVPAEPLTRESTPANPPLVEPAGTAAGPSDPPSTVDGEGAHAALPAGEVDSRWSEIVTQLREPADPRAWAPDPDVAEAEDHFVPPDPEPVLGGDPLLTMAWSAVVGAALMVVVVVVGWRDAPTWVLQAAGAALLGGAGLLVWRMPHDRDEDDDDPGAVV